MKLLTIILLAIVIISGIGDDTCQKEADAGIISSYCR